jgi:dipeptidyl aminopeptidase/acylaminoacyl peptidase
VARRPKRAFVPEDSYRVRTVSDPQISPDGSRIAFVVATPDREQDKVDSVIWIADRGGKHARPFTTGSRSDTPRWSPDGASLAFVSKRSERTQIYVASLDGGDPRELTRSESGVGQPAWSPDGTRIAYVAPTGKAPAGNGGDEVPPAERAKPKVIRDLYFRFDGEGLYDERRRHIFTVEVASGESTQITDGDWQDGSPAWSPDGRSIAFLSNRSPERFNSLPRNDLWLVSAKGGRTRRLSRGRGNVGPPVFSPDGAWIAAAGHEHTSAVSARNAHVLLFPARGAARAPRVLTAELDRSVHGLYDAPGSQLAWLPDSERVLFIAGDRGAYNVFSAELASGACKRAIEGDRIIDSLALAPDGKTITFPSRWSSELPELWSAPLGRGGSGTRISDVNAELRREAKLAPTQRITVRSPDGLEIDAFVLRPEGRGPFPLWLDIHGGPHGSHPQVFGPLYYQIVVGAGYAALLPNPRGSSTYGEEFMQACLVDWGGGDYADIMASVDRVTELGIADPDRLYVAGYSYGGYMSSWIIGHTDRFRAASIGAPLTNLVSALGTSDIPHVMIHEMGGTPLSAPDTYAKHSPINHVAGATTAVQLQHWEGDLRCPIAQAEELFYALKLQGRDVEFLRYPGGSHIGRSPSQGVDAMTRQIAWFDAHAPRKARSGGKRGARRHKV